jgi:hypothetical protein
MAEADYDNIKDDLAERNIKYQIADQYPHCYGEMNWILKYPVGQERDSCLCRHSHSSYKLTRGIE